MGNRVEAAKELIVARDNLRALQAAGRATDGDVKLVRAAEEKYTEASRDFSEQE